MSIRWLKHRHAEELEERAPVHPWQPAAHQVDGVVAEQPQAKGIRVLQELGRSGRCKEVRAVAIRADL